MDPVQITVGDIKTLIILLASPESKVCASAIDGLVKHAQVSQKNRIQLLEANVITHLIEACTSKAADVRKAAITCLSILSESTDIHQDMRRKDLIKTLIAAMSLEDCDVEILDEAAMALANLAKDFSNKAEIRKEGGIATLVKLLDSIDPDVKKSATSALCQLLDDLGNRAEIRNHNGIKPLIELCGSEFVEIQEQALEALIKCADDAKNRVEIKNLNGIKKLAGIISVPPGSSHHLALTCLAKCLADNDNITVFNELAGLQSVVSLILVDDNHIKKSANWLLSKACRTADNQVLVRDLNGIPSLVASLGSTDHSLSCSAAAAISAVAKNNEKNQLELLRLGAIELLVRLLVDEDILVRREAGATLAVLLSHYKVKTKVKALDGYAILLKLLADQDNQIVLNAAECFNSLAEEYTCRIDLIKFNLIGAIMTCITERDNPNVVSTLLLVLAKCLQELDGQLALSKAPLSLGIGKLVELLASSNAKLCKSACYALKNAIQHHPNAVSACNLGAIEKILPLLENESKSSSMSYLIYNIDLSAKFWLENHIEADEFIEDGFYDAGSKGQSKTFPKIGQLESMPIDSKREVIRVNFKKDACLANLITTLSTAIREKAPQERVYIIGQTVAYVCGGSVQGGLNEHFYKFRIAELKLQHKSNILPIGSIDSGTFYHRALLFKVLCDKLSIPVSLSRGEYNRAWNVVDLKDWERWKCPIISPEEAELAKKAPEGYFKEHFTDLSKMVKVETPGPFVVDLMFSPGNLLDLSSNCSNNYQRIN